MASDRDEMVLDQIRAIGEEIQSEQPMVGNLNSPTVLIQEYQNNELPGFIPGIIYLWVSFLRNSFQHNRNQFLLAMTTLFSWWRHPFGFSVFRGRQYRAMRRIRGDGNCFYRAFLFSYLENLILKHSSSESKIAAEKEKDRFYQQILRSKAELVDLGYSEMAIESFHDVSYVWCRAFKDK